MPIPNVVTSVQGAIQRWGIQGEPSWVHAAEVTQPAAGSALASRKVGAGKSGLIYGFFISTDELGGNEFLLKWTSVKKPYQRRIVFSAAGTQQAIDATAENNSSPADAGSTVSIVVVNAGGLDPEGNPYIYQAELLYAEE